MLPIRFSHLKACGRSPEHAQEAMSGAEPDETYAMERGSAVHAMLFGTRRVTYYPEFSDEVDEKTGELKKQVRKGKKWDAFAAANADAEILTENEYVKAAGMVRRLRGYPRAMELLRGPGVVNEHTLLAKLQGRDCRGTPDARGPEGIVDLKTTGRAGVVDFYYHVKRMGYHVQLAWYARMAVAAGVPCGPDRWLVAVEEKPPHTPQVYKLPPDLVEEGDKLATTWFEDLLNCERSGTWPGYGPPEMLLELPFRDMGLNWGGDEADEAA
jgi:hypothetical protein